VHKENKASGIISVIAKIPVVQSGNSSPWRRLLSIQANPQEPLSTLEPELCGALVLHEDLQLETVIDFGDLLTGLQYWRPQERSSSHALRARTAPQIEQAVVELALLPEREKIILVALITVRRRPRMAIRRRSSLAGQTAERILDSKDQGSGPALPCAGASKAVGS
jgi:hypothetical protein